MSEAARNIYDGLEADLVSRGKLDANGDSTEYKDDVIAMIDGCTTIYTMLELSNPTPSDLDDLIGTIRKVVGYQMTLIAGALYIGDTVSAETIRTNMDGYIRMLGDLGAR
jgi:xanthosine utilization system XapX-like protein